ncbi:MAG: amino acid adenylation domain-containing protein, partial [Cyanobacteria bacterium P01_H01_bin.15]
VKRTAIADMYPLSPMQQGLLFHSLLTPVGGSYVPQVVLTLSGVIDSDIFKTAWQTIFQRHTILRTGFYWEQREEPFQVVYRQVPLPWVEQDWIELPPTAQAAKLSTLLSCNRSEPFNLNKPPLIRLVWARCNEARYQLIWCYHHLLLDGWSTGQVLKDVFQEYFRQVGTLPNVALPAAQSYGRFIAWLQKQDASTTLKFWTEYLAGWSGPTPLPILQAAPGGTLIEAKHAFSATKTQQLRTFVQAHQITLNTLVQGALGLLLSRYLNRHDVVFGTTSAGRSPELTGSLTMVGLLINTLPVRVQIAPNRKVIDWLQALSQQQAQTSPYEQVSLRELQGAVNDGRGLFDCLLVFESYPVPAEMFRGQTSLNLETVQFDEWTHFPLTLLVSGDDELLITAKYRDVQIGTAAITRLLDHLSGLLKTLTTQPEAQLHQIALLSPTEQQPLQQWNQQAPPLPLTTQSLTTLLNEQAQKTPDVIAVQFDDQTLAYQTLHQQADRLGASLQAHGVGAEARVAIYLERSLNLPVAVLGVLKAGAAYVPIDPSYPAARRDWMLENAQVAAIVIDSTQELPALNAPETTLIDLAQPLTTETAIATAPTQPEQSVYLIYTSGSTGQPKGVINTQKGLLNRLQWMQQAYGLSSGDRVLQKTPLSFDVSVWEFLWPLMTGATLVMAKPEGHKDGVYLRQVVKDQRITTLHFVPSMLAVFLESAVLEYETPETFPDIKRVICSGEALTPALQARFFEAFPQVELHNLYGPTEAAIDVTAWTCQPADSTVPIGQPISNTQIHLLDQDLNPLPVGIPGELYIAGVGLARGYHGQPALTAERFIPNPFGKPGSVLYKTGDLARYRPDGVIEYIGRQDTQIKLRGVRIELGEIETALASHPAIKHCAVAYRSDLPSGPALVAYLIGELTQSDLKATLDRFLESRLPAALLPSFYVALDVLPLTPNGKCDRKALPLPEFPAAAQSQPPATGTEVAIAEIWGEVLKQSDFSVHDNFFERGGHSLSATRLHTRLRQRFELTFPLHQVFEYPTIATMATHIDALTITVRRPTPTGHKEITL